MLLTGSKERVPKRALVHCVRIDLVTEISGVAQPLHDAVTHPYGHPLDVHKQKRFGRHVSTGHLGQHSTGHGTCNLKTCASVGNILDVDPGLKMASQPSLMHRLIPVGRGQLEFVLAKTGDGEVTNQSSFGRQHRGKAHPSHIGNPARHNPVQPGSRT